ncbi:hypothetical protein GCM10022247_06990 [Allokutzneria multivorans]|uniref:Uncharacterized protein n=1 Tax=Allokutzneria multivorans TaxID=1142134 RepID=A0ABP7R0G1_9PSEU
MIVSALIANKFRYASTTDAAEALIEEALSGRFWHTLTKFYVSDHPCTSGDDDGHGEHFPDHQLSVGTNTAGTLAALHFCAFGADEILVQSLSEQQLPNAPEIIYDTDAQMRFPTNAAIHRDAARVALIEYCRTGTQPSSVAWQPCEII